MSCTIADVQTPLNTFIRDTTTDSVSAAERLEAINEATAWLIEQTTNDHQIRTYNLDYVPTIHSYKISSALADFLEPADLRRAEADQDMPATRKATREMAEDIAVGSSEFAFGIQRKDGAAYAIINLQGKYQSQVLATFDTTTADGGTWVAAQDASNVATDDSNFTAGSGSVSFDVSGATTVAQLSSTITSQDLSEFADNAILTLDVHIPDATYTSSVTLYWGNSSTVYYSVTSTTDMQGNTIASGDNTFKFNWADATETGSVDDTAIDYVRIDINYSASQGADTGYRLDNLQIAKPERLVFYYMSHRLGTESGTTVYKYTTTAAVPYYSGQYDYYRFAVAHKGAAILFRSMGLLQDAVVEESEADKALKPKQKIFPSSLVKEDRQFKAKGINFNKRKF